VKLWKKVLIGLGALIVVALLGVLGFASYQASAYDQSMARVYDLPLRPVQRSSDPAVLARGAHLAASIGACQDCHGADLGGKLMGDMGPVGAVYSPNISPGGAGGKYSDAELARLLRDGIKRDGTSLLFMPSWDFRWWSEADVVALISWFRVQPASKRASGASHIGVLGKVLDRMDMLPIDVARRIDHSQEPVLAPEPTASVAYGQFLGKLCEGCHGPSLSGGPIPGAPPDMAIPANLTPHETGLASWSEETFYKVISTGVRPDGRKLDAMMPVATLAAMNETEKKALWLYLRSVPAKTFGGR
jgi:mono/diheme cytochrome c family protein